MRAINCAQIGSKFPTEKPLVSEGGREHGFLNFVKGEGVGILVDFAAHLAMPWFMIRMRQVFVNIHASSLKHGTGNEQG